MQEEMQQVATKGPTHYYFISLAHAARGEDDTRNEKKKKKAYRRCFEVDLHRAKILRVRREYLDGSVKHFLQCSVRSSDKIGREIHRQGYT